METTFERKMILTEERVEKLLDEVTLRNMSFLSIIARKDVKSCRHVIIGHKASLTDRITVIEEAYGVKDNEETKIFTEYEENEAKKKEKVKNYIEGKSVEVMTPEVQHYLIEVTGVRTGAYLMYYDNDHELLLECFKSLAGAINRAVFKVPGMVCLNLTVYPDVGDFRLKLATECIDFALVVREIEAALDAVPFGNQITISHKFDVLWTCATRTSANATLLVVQFVLCLEGSRPQVVACATTSTFCARESTRFSECEVLLAIHMYISSVFTYV